MVIVFVVERQMRFDIVSFVTFWLWLTYRLFLIIISAALSSFSGLLAFPCYALGRVRFSIFVVALVLFLTGFLTIFYCFVVILTDL